MARKATRRGRRRRLGDDATWRRRYLFSVALLTSFFASFFMWRASFFALRIFRFAWRLVFSAPLSVCSVSLTLSVAFAALSFTSFIVSLSANTGSARPMASAAMIPFLIRFPLASAGRMAGGSPGNCARAVRCTTTRRRTGYRSFGWLLAGSRVSDGVCESAGFCVSVGCPVTSPGRDDMPGSVLAEDLGDSPPAIQWTGARKGEARRGRWLLASSLFSSDSQADAVQDPSKSNSAGGGLRAGLRAEARPTAAGMLRVRVLEAEPALAELSLDVVDLHAEQVHRAHRVDEALDALDLEHHVAGPLVLFDVQAVLEPGAPAADDGDAQAGALQALALDGLLDHGGGLVGQLDGCRGLGLGLRRRIHVLGRGFHERSIFRCA